MCGRVEGVEGQVPIVGCTECGSEQDRGRFCGRCGAAISWPERNLPADERAKGSSEESSEGPASVQRSGPMRGPTSRGSGGWRWVVALAIVVLSIVVLSIVVWDAGRTVETEPAVDAPTESPSADGANPSLEPPAGPSPGPEAAPGDLDDPGPSGEVVQSADTFRDATRTVLLFDDGFDGVLAVDLDTWEERRISVPGQRPGGQPFRLVKLDDWIVAGWGAIWAVRPGDPETARQLGDATVFLADAGTDALWLIDYESGFIGAGESPPTLLPAGSSTWTLIDPSGDELAAVSSAPAGLEPLRGLPGGLAVDSPHGVMVYDLEENRLIENPVGSEAILTDATRTRSAWCRRDPCDQLVIIGQDMHERGTIGNDEIFDPNQVWLSPGGDRIAAGVRVPAGEAVDLRLRIYRTDDGQRLADTQIAAGSLYGAWTSDGRQFFGWNHLPHTVDAPAILHRWAGGDDIERITGGDHGIRDVYGLLALPSERLQGVFKPTQSEHEPP